MQLMQYKHQLDPIRLPFVIDILRDDLVLFYLVVVPALKLLNHFFTIYHVLLRSYNVFQLFCFPTLNEVSIKQLNVTNLVYFTL